MPSYQIAKRFNKNIAQLHNSAIKIGKEMPFWARIDVIFYSKVLPVKAHKTHCCKMCHISWWKAHFLRKLEVIIGPTRIYTRDYSHQWVFLYFFFQTCEIIATHRKCVIFIIDCFESYFKLTLRWLWWWFCWLTTMFVVCVDFDNVDEDNICCTTNKRWYVAR